MARAAVGTNDALLLSFGEDIHYTPIARSPVAVGQAVHQADVDVVRSQFPAEAVQVGTRFLWVPCPSLGEHGDLVSRNMFEGLGDMGMTAIGVRGVEEAQPVVVPVEQQVGEPFYAQIGLVRMMSRAHRP